jgi:hypothetical protein
VTTSIGEAASIRGNPATRGAVSRPSRTPRVLSPSTRRWHQVPGVIQGNELIAALGNGVIPYKEPKVDVDVWLGSLDELVERSLSTTWNPPR